LRHSVLAIFWDAECVLLIDFMSHKVTVMLTYFTNCVSQSEMPKKADQGTFA